MALKAIDLGEESGSLADAVAGRLRELIHSGRWPPGFKLPTERQLIEQLEVSRSPLREALKMLESAGLIHAHVGRGRFVQGQLSAQASLSLVRTWLQAHRRDLEHLNQIRCAIEPAAVRLIPRAALPSLVEELRAGVEEAALACARGDAIRMSRLDRDFHATICEAASNPPMVAMAVGLIEATMPFGQRVYAIPEAARNSLADHTAITNALAAGDLRLARRLVERHHRLAFKVALTHRVEGEGEGEGDQPGTEDASRPTPAASGAAGTPYG
ncbi:FadR/GntR family transcriptional regulator [Actinopolymorpha pittospori]|uniref:DNA-binding FadR family transcriptional regulator n=1 Tax=Actinopolymorpha pittospori TaxID=648752 RepID=A0A927N002_9ACTN|nr:GntR family transcriptional regulator [Actinopolymorpha pittospori]MBE1609292.1 DNA-binding FadR family transcriptional regulator [Actinopolymorpha pittospori]